MTSPQPELDVDLLQRAIQEQAGTGGPEPPFYQLHLRQLAPLLEAAVRVEPNPTLLGRTRYERVWVIINRLVRRVARHGVEPAVLAQNQSNLAVLRAFHFLTQADAALHAEVARLRAEQSHDHD
jgi:hypothetical protein